jgi:hypothetical protein
MEGLQSDSEALLPIGYQDGKGGIHRRAVLRKMRGHEEALFYDGALSAGRLVTELIARCLVRLGDLPAVTPELSAQLFSADRNYLVVELRRITLGNELPASYTCPSCGGETAVVERLGDLEVRRLPEGAKPEVITVELDDGYRDRDGALHKQIRLRLPRGIDEESVSRAAEQDPLRARDALTLRCIESFGTLRKESLEAYGIKILRDLTMGDRRRLYQAVESASPGIDFRRTIHCGRCGSDFGAVLEASGFFVTS